MALYLIGLGLNDIKDISVKGMETARNCDRIYFENYTGIFTNTPKEIGQFLGKEIIPADRTMVEQKAEETLLADAKGGDTALLVIGDPLSATTHQDLVDRARELGISVEVIHNASIFSAVGFTGLQVYKFGKTTSIPFPQGDWEPETPYDVLKDNKALGYHTLFLLDVRAEEHRFMTIPEAIKVLEDLEARRQEGLFTKDTFCVGCARLGSEEPIIIAGNAADLAKKDFGMQPHCLIVPGELHFKEEEALAHFKI